MIWSTLRINFFLLFAHMTDCWVCVMLMLWGRKICNSPWKVKEHWTNFREFSFWISYSRMWKRVNVLMGDVFHQFLRISYCVAWKLFRVENHLICTFELPPFSLYSTSFQVNLLLTLDRSRLSKSKALIRAFSLVFFISQKKKEKTNHDRVSISLLGMRNF